MPEVPIEIIIRNGFGFWIFGFCAGISVNVLICFILYMKFLRPKTDLDEIKRKFAEIIADAMNAVTRNDNALSAITVAYVKMLPLTNYFANNRDSLRSHLGKMLRSGGHTLVIMQELDAILREVAEIEAIRHVKSNEPWYKRLFS